MGIGNNPNGIFPLFQTTGQQGIILQYGVDAHHNAHAVMTELMDMGPGRLPGNPSGMPGKGGCLASSVMAYFMITRGRPVFM